MNLGEPPPTKQAPEPKTLLPHLQRAVPQLPVTVPYQQLPLKDVVAFPLASIGHTVLACCGTTVSVGTAICVKNRHVFKCPAEPCPNFYYKGLRKLSSVHHKLLISCIYSANTLSEQE